MTCIAVLLFTAAPAPARADDELTDKLIELLSRSGSALQCGPATITVTPDKKPTGTGLPPGDYPIEMKDLSSCFHPFWKCLGIIAIV